jgi:two-component system response regulator AtoC
MTLLNPLKRPFLSASSSFAGPFFGRNSQMQQIRRNLELLAKTDLPVLLLGESGTGKDAVAALLHQESKTSGNLVKVNCIQPFEGLASLEELGASERDGLPDILPGLASGDTLLMDGIHELDLSSQGKLLLMLKEKDGPNATRSMSESIRMISTSTMDLQELVDAGRFRLDLLYRINAVKFVLPPLRNRPEDIAGLTDYFLEKHARETHRSRPMIPPQILQMMEGYNWPGNIRQLDHLIRNFILLGTEEVIIRELSETNNASHSHWSLEQIDISRPVALKEITRQATHDLERQIILRVLQANGWNRQKTAKWLQISYRSLLYKLSDFGSGERIQQRVQPISDRGYRAANF